MRLPTISTRAERLLEHGHFTASQLVSTPDVPDSIRQEFLQANDALKARIGENADARLAALIVLGTCDQKGYDLETAIRNLAHEVKLAAMHHFRSPLYKSYFPEGLGKVLAGSAQVRIDNAKVILTKLDRATDERLRAHTPLIESALGAFEEVVRAHADATTARDAAWTSLQNEKYYWAESYRKTHNGLKVHYASMPRKAERFFRKLHHARGGEQPQSPAVEQNEATADSSDTTPTPITTMTSTTMTSATPTTTSSQP